MDSPCSSGCHLHSLEQHLSSHNVPISELNYQLSDILYLQEHEKVKKLQKKLRQKRQGGEATSKKSKSGTHSASKALRELQNNLHESQSLTDELKKGKEELLRAMEQVRAERDIAILELEHYIHEARTRVAAKEHDDAVVQIHGAQSQLADRPVALDVNRRNELQLGDTLDDYEACLVTTDVGELDDSADDFDFLWSRWTETRDG